MDFLPFCSPGDLPDPATQPMLLASPCIGRLILYHWAASKALKILVPSAINGIVIVLLSERSASHENMLHTCYLILKLYMSKVRVNFSSTTFGFPVLSGCIILLCSTAESALIPPSLVSTFDPLPGPKDFLQLISAFFLSFHFL